VLVIFACWGLSSCLIEKDKILSGRNSLIGEIGHMIIDPSDPEKCGCGSHGCFERLVSEGRIRQLMREKASDFPDSSLLSSPIEQITIPALFDASRSGDPLARELVDYLARTFSLALRNISLVFDPELIVFQGDYAYADEYFDESLRKHLLEFKYYPSGGSFETRYDSRPLSEMNALGSYIALVQNYFDIPELYV
jgi:predicted NBD/HSP70 family sugar kinase